MLIIDDHITDYDEADEAFQNGFWARYWDIMIDNGIWTWMIITVNANGVMES